VELLLNEQQNLLAETAARLCADFGGPKRLRALNSAGAETDKEAWRGLIGAGWLSTVVAERHGGSGLGAFDFALVAEQAGKQLLQVPLVEAAAAARTLSMAASDGASPSAILSELLAGTRVIVPATTASFWSYVDGPSPVSFDAKASSLGGTTPFVPFAQSADAFMIAVESRPEAIVCIVPRDAPGITVTTGRNVDGSASSTLVLDRVLPQSIIATGATARQLTLELQEFLMLGAGVELLGLAAAALDVTLDYIKLRQQFGRPIGSFQVLQHRAVNSFVDIELNRSLAYRVISAFDAGEHDRAMVSAVKARTSRCALEIIRGALQMHGAIGYTDEHDIGLYYKRAIALAARYGNELHHTGRFSDLTLGAPRAERARAGASP
jgi:alkylation response protein AidB-like acyl-CoA dehydrogenase